MGEIPHPLNYQQPAHRHPRRNALLVALGTIAIMLVTGSPIWREARGTFNRLSYEIRLYRLEKDCLAHPTQPGVLVYQSRVGALSINSPQLTAFLKMYPANLNFLSSGAFGIYPGTPAAPRFATVYVGTRRASNGLNSFIAVQVLYNQFGVAGFTLVNRPLEIANPAQDPPEKYIPAPNDFTRLDQSAPRPYFQVYSGIEDAADPSHFSFAYDAGIWHGTIDCRLQPNGSLRTECHEIEWTITPQGTRSLPFIPWLLEGAD